jgi:hypothetical protein
LITAIIFIVLGLISNMRGGGETYTIIFFAIGLMFFYAHHLHVTFQEVIDKERQRTTLNEQDITKLIKEIGEIQQIQEGQDMAEINNQNIK